LPRGIHIRKLAFHRQGTFAKASRCASVSTDATGRPSWASVDSELSGLQGFIYILMPHKTRQHSWERCWADLRAHHLVVRRANGRSLGREAALPLPGAEVLPLECLFASELAGWLASQRARGFELRGLAFDAGGRRGGPLVARVEGAAAAERWERALQAEADRPGVGALWVCGGGRCGRWERRWCVVDFQAKRLCCYARPHDHILGQEPRRVLQLGSASLRSLDDAGELMPAAPAGSAGGFEVEELPEPAAEGETASGWFGGTAEAAGCATSFATDSPQALKRWLAALQAVCCAASLRKSFCQPLDLGDTPPPGQPGDKVGSSGEDSPFAALARQRPSFALAMRSTTGKQGPRCVDLLAACEAAVAAEAAAAAETEAAEAAAGAEVASGGTCDASDGGQRPGASLPDHKPSAEVVRQGPEAFHAAVPGAQSLDAAEPGLASPAPGGGSGSLPRPQRPRASPQPVVPPLALGLAALREDPMAALPSQPAESEVSFGSSDSETGTFKTAASVAQSIASDETDTDVEQEEPGTVGRLRRLGRELRAEATELEESLKAGEFAAQTTLRFFDEEPRTGSSLAALQTFLGQIASFARDFSSAVQEVRRREESKAKAQAKAHPKVPAKAHPQAFPPSRRQQPGRGARPAFRGAYPRSAVPAEDSEGQCEPRKDAVSQPLGGQDHHGLHEPRKDVVVQPLASQASLGLEQPQKNVVEQPLPPQDRQRLREPRKDVVMQPFAPQVPVHVGGS